MTRKKYRFFGVLFAVFMLTGCRTSTSKVTETTEESTEETQNIITIPTDNLESTSETKDSLDEKTDIENLYNKYSSVMLNVKQYNTQDSDEYDISLYFENQSDSDYRFIYSDSDGYNMMQTSYFGYLNSYGEESCYTENLVSTDEIFNQIGSFYMCTEDITEIEGSFEQDGYSYIVCTADAGSMGDTLSAWGYSEETITVLYGFNAEDEIHSISFYNEDKMLMNTEFVFNKADENVENIIDSGDECFKNSSIEENSTDETLDQDS